MLKQFLEWRESGSKTPAELIALCRERIAWRDGEVRAWVCTDEDATWSDGPLAGIPFGVKDIFETFSLPTAYGSNAEAPRRSSLDAALVSRFRKLGAVLLGKTHTAAYAYFDAPPTRNPRDPRRTPGGSSSGSAAAVADGMVPFALGTQTQGSILRPASYCGVTGFKPTFGLLPLNGAMAFAPTLDTAGLFTETPADMNALWACLFDASAIPAKRLGVLPRNPVVKDGMCAAMAETIEKLHGEGFEVEEIELPEDWAALGAAVKVVNDYEGARTHRSLFEKLGGTIGAKLTELVKRGLSIDDGRYMESRALMVQMREIIEAVYGEFPALLSPAAADAAPIGFANTGDPALNAPWTALRGPAIALPMRVAGPPLGLQLTAASGDDASLLATAEAIYKAIH